MVIATFITGRLTGGNNNDKLVQSRTPATTAVHMALYVYGAVYEYMVCARIYVQLT